MCCLSTVRSDLSFAVGWHLDDVVLAPAGAVSNGPRAVRKDSFCAAVDIGSGWPSDPTERRRSRVGRVRELGVAGLFDPNSPA